MSDPAVFAVNRLPAHSDHAYYANRDEAMSRAAMTMRHSLNGAWKFMYAPNPASRAADFYKPEFGVSGWDDIEVPGHIQIQGYGQMQYVNTMYPWDGHELLRPPAISETDNPVGSYVKEFEVPASMTGKPLFISFQGVETAFYVWLNGEFVGYGEDSFTPSEFELTPFVREGANKLAVEVYQRSTGAWLEDQDFWRFSGIFRDVYLYTVPEVHVYDVHVKAEVDASLKNGTLSAALTFREAPPAGSCVIMTVKDAAGGEAASAALDLDGTLQPTLSAQVGDPSLWSAEDPYLYEVLIEVMDANGLLVEAIPQRVGFRRFEMKNKIMTLNGQRVVFKGVNRHEFNPRRGRAITKEDMLWDIKTLKQNNMNAVRTSHYPNQSLWYELCDLYGVYVIDEMNLETHGSWQKMGAVEPSWNIPGSKPEWQDIVMDRAISMYERDKNHPSILIWSLGNESYVGDVLVNVARYFRSVDDGRLVHYEGVFYDRAFTEASDMESRMYAKPQDIKEYLDNDPPKPYISCEYMHAMGNSLGGMKKYTDLEREYPMYQGGFIWDYIDQSVYKKDRYGKEYLAYGGDFGDRPTDYGFCTNGIVYADRRVSPKMQEVKFLYQNVKLTVDRNGVNVRNENLFVDTSAYELVCTLYVDGRELESVVMEAIVAPLAEQRFPVKLGDPQLEAGEYVLEASYRLKESALWAEKGFEVAFGQHVFRVTGEATVEAEGVGRELKVVHGDVNIGVHGRDFSAMFSKQAMSLISLRYGGREMIAAPPVPLFWRATTDNDRGFAQGFTSGAWFAASLARKGVVAEVTEEAGSVTVAYRYTFSINAETETVISYTVRADGSIRVQSNYKGAAGLPQMPIFAVSFKVPADYDRLDWYAHGPEENYADRANGARLCRFEGTVAGQVSDYAMPQESGNRTGVRRVSVTDALGKGIRIVADGEPVECNFSPYTAFELEAAQHVYELPPVHYTVVTVAGRQMGVGGDDSWGAPVHDEFTIPADEDMAFSFVIERA
nr:glycoside hydrolase family 2 TIM barrel-domain containing protein [Paenibacillus soyae]